MTMFKPKISDVLFTDTETFSTVDIKTAGTVKYCESADLLLGGFYLDGRYDYYDFSEEGSVIPQWVHSHAEAGGWFAAHNALFDYIVLKKHIPSLKLNQMIDTMGWCGTACLPLGLDKAGKALEIPEDTQKLKEGKRLVMKFCVPRRPSKNNPSTRVMPEDAPDEWRVFRDDYLYNDVIGMIEIYERLPGYSSFDEHSYWVDTQIINLEGIPVDVETAQMIVDQLDGFIDDQSTEFIRRTGLFPTQRDKVLGWVRKQGVKITNLQAATVADVVANPKTPEIVKEALEYRANTTHMSFKKFPVILAATRDDGTVGGTLMYHVATTGRFGGRLLQPQNLTRGDIDGNEAVERVKAGEFSVPLIKSCVRPMIYHPDGLTIVDYAQIEGRGVLWACDDWDNLAEYTGDEDPYVLMAQKIFQQMDIDGKQRFVGKQARLGLGYQMGWKKFVFTCENYGEKVHTDLAQKAVKVFRNTHPKVVQFWSDMQGAAVMALNHIHDTVRLSDKVSFHFDGKWLRMILPSGRSLFYYHPHLERAPEDWQQDSFSYMSMNDKHQYVRTATYGGKLTENLVQAFCRDILVEAVSELLSCGFRVITHIHDEIVVAGMDQQAKIEQIMCERPNWCEDFPIEVEGVVTPRYIKA